MQDEGRYTTDGGVWLKNEDDVGGEVGVVGPGGGDQGLGLGNAQYPL